MKHGRWIVGSALMALLVARAAVASIGLPLTRDALITQSDVVVIGRVASIASAVDPAVDGVYTYVTIQPAEILKGFSGAGSIVVKQFGGLVGNRGVYVPGQARFRVGENVLLFLGIRARDRSLFTIGLWQGKWAIEVDASGQPVAFKRDPKTSVLVDRSALSVVRSDLARRAGFDRARDLEINIAPVETPRGSSPFVLNDPPIRWTKPLVPVNVETGTQPGLAGGGLAQVVASVAQWNAAGSSLTLQNGVRLPARCQNSVGTDILITFGDPCGEISSDPSLLAVAAFGFSFDNAQVIGGRTFLPITDAVITTSAHPAAQPLLTTPPCFQSTIAHEIGHAIGLDHTPDPFALMFASETGACFAGPIPLNADDLGGLFAIYPTGGPPPVPPPGAGPPGQPTVTNATVTGATLQITWTSGAGGTPTSHRLDFFSGGVLVTSVTLGAATAAALPIPPGTVGSFGVRVTALVGATAGPPSALFPFMIGGGGGGGGGCTGPPAAPVVTGSIVAGTATVTWVAVAGATSYIVSAGSSQGGSNISPPANVGATTSVGASGLPPGFSTWVRVIAVNACGQSAPGDFFLSSGPGPAPPPGAGGFIEFSGSASACSCWTSPITLQVDGQTIGSMACSGSAGPFAVSAGAHTYRACDALGCITNDTIINSMATLTVSLTCQ